MKKMILTIIVVFFMLFTASQASAFLKSGRIDGAFTYKQLSLVEVPGGCVLKGIITNTSKKTQTGKNITFKAYDKEGNFMGDHTIKLPTISAASTHSFEEKIIGCEKNVHPFRLEFDVQE